VISSAPNVKHVSSLVKSLVRVVLVVIVLPTEIS